MTRTQGIQAKKRSKDLDELEHYLQSFLAQRYMRLREELLKTIDLAREATNDALIHTRKKEEIARKEFEEISNNAIVFSGNAVL